jgi:multidrug resistance efflux pump
VRPFALLGVALLLLGGWAAWFVWSRVTIYEMSQRARLELDDSVHPISTPILGRVVASHLTLGKRVEAGELLVELDASAEQRRLDQERAHLASLRPQLEALRAEVAAEEQVLSDTRSAGKRALEVARAHRAEAASAARFAVAEAQHIAAAGRSATTEIEQLKARAEVEKRRAALAALGSETRRLGEDQRKEGSQIQVHLEQLRRNIAQAEGEAAVSEATVRTLEQEVERHRIRAAAAGIIGEIETVQVGAVLHEGERLGSIVPPEGSRLKVVASFAPDRALGRIHPGQHARIRLDGFPWTQHGSLRARVARVAAEVHDNQVRVELALEPDASQRIPLQHGLPGTAEIEIDRVAPLALLLRSAGQTVHSQPQTDQPATAEVSR